MFNNRKERAELLEGLVISNKDAKVPNLEQVPAHRHYLHIINLIKFSGCLIKKKTLDI